MNPNSSKSITTRVEKILRNCFNLFGEEASLMSVRLEAEKLARDWLEEIGKMLESVMNEATKEAKKFMKKY